MKTQTFESIHQGAIVGTLSTFDRLIFKGHLQGLFPKGCFAAFLGRQKVLLKDFGPYVKRATDQLKARAEQLAQEAGRPFQYLEQTGQSKEDLARAIAARDGVTAGLIVVFAAVEPCRNTFRVRCNHETHLLEVVRQPGKCRFFYFYYLDREFGLMHVRLQSWFPFEMQVYVNGREWLARVLDQHGIAYARHENSFTSIADLPAAQKLCAKFARRRWPAVLNALARRVNPMLPVVQRAGFGGYYWVTDQCEYATDVMFRDRASLLALYPDLVTYAIETFSAPDVLRFLGRKLHGNFQGDLHGDLKTLKGRPEGRRVKFWLRGNSLKMYDKGSVLRVETTINNPSEFRVLRVLEQADGARQRRWCPMRKGVVNFWRYAQVAEQSNARFLEALAQAPLKSAAIQELDRLSRARVVDGKRYARFQPLSAADTRLFAAALAGEHALNGFRNKQLQARLYSAPATTPEERRQRSARVSRLIAKLRGHGLIAKVKDCRLYRVTQRGARLMAAALRCRNIDFPDELLQAIAATSV